MATGFAKGARARGKQVAFGDGKKLIWDQHSQTIFYDNPNICRPGNEKGANVEWVPFYRGNRIYNKQGAGRWIWNYDFKAAPGELYFHPDEWVTAERFGNGFVVLEPNVPVFKGCAPNKQWPVARYDDLAAKLRDAGHRVVQFHHNGPNKLKNASLLPTRTFRYAAALLQRAALYIGPEGGLHHASAATGYRNKHDGRKLGEGCQAVVLYGGFVPPEVTGYDTHTNLTGNSKEACGSISKCQHCIEAMQSIEVDEVFEAAMQRLGRRAA